MKQIVGLPSDGDITELASESIFNHNGDWEITDLICGKRHDSKYVVVLTKDGKVMRIGGNKATKKVKPYIKEQEGTFSHFGNLVFVSDKKRRPRMLVVESVVQFKKFLRCVVYHLLDANSLTFISRLVLESRQEFPPPVVRHIKYLYRKNYTVFVSIRLASSIDVFIDYNGLLVSVFAEYSTLGKQFNMLITKFARGLGIVIAAKKEIYRINLNNI